MNVVLNSPEFSFFNGAKEQLEQMIAELQSEHQASTEHGAIELRWVSQLFLYWLI